MKHTFAKAAAAAALALSASGAFALSCTLHASNVGIEAASFTCSEAGGVISIHENYINAGMGVVHFSGLASGTVYTVQKYITNSSGADWERLANELLDPKSSGNDALDPAIQPAFVPVGYSTSNDSDGLHFNQGGSSARTSTVFGSVFADELSDSRDFLDFFGGTLINTGTDFFMTYGLVNASTDDEFLLVQRPNESSRTPEPGTLALLGAALLGLGATRRRN